MSEQQEQTLVIKCGCGMLLTAQEIQYYGVNCERCEKGWITSLGVAGIALPPNKVLERGTDLDELMEHGRFWLASELLSAKQQISSLSLQLSSSKDQLRVAGDALAHADAQLAAAQMALSEKKETNNRMGNELLQRRLDIVTQASTIDTLRSELERVTAERLSTLTKGLLVSMAMRAHHGFGLLSDREKEYYIGEARRAWEEISGGGFYRPEREAEYAAMWPVKTENPNTNASVEPRPHSGGEGAGTDG